MGDALTNVGSSPPTVWGGALREYLDDSHAVGKNVASLPKSLLREDFWSAPPKREPLFGVVRLVVVRATNVPGKSEISHLARPHRVHEDVPACQVTVDKPARGEVSHPIGNPDHKAGQAFLGMVSALEKRVEGAFLAKLQHQ